VGLVAGSVSLVLALVIGGWFWYAWFGCVPKPVFSVRFENPAYSGQSALCDQNQIVFLHGGTLARHDMKEKREVWSHYLIDKKEIEDEIAQDIKETKLLIDKANHEGWENTPKMPDPEKLARQLERSAAESMHLRVQGHNIWIAHPGKLVRYDWDSGKPVKEISLADRFGQLIPRGDELLLLANGPDKQVITHINLTTCDTRTEEIAGPKPPEVAATGKKPAPGKKPSGIQAKKASSSDLAGLPLGMPGRDAGKPMDPAKVAEQAQHLSLPAKIALPATLSSSFNQERALNEMNDQARRGASGDDELEPSEHFSLIPTRDGFVQFAVKLIEARMTRRTAMKSAPAKSALEGNVTVAKTMEVANEILNDMQRSRGGDTVVEDESRYQVIVRQPNARETWSGEIIGRPGIYPLKSVNVVTGNKSMIVLDKSNKKLWQATLSYNVVGGPGSLEEEDARYGQGPCVERDNSLYVFDQGVLTAFDLKSGDVRWRVPSVGIAGLFFDDKGMLYVNTSTASPDSIKYSKQIDISQKTGSVILKIDPKSGKQLWAAQPGGLINHVNGKYLYVVQSYRPHESEDESPYTVETGFETPPYLRIKRINPKNGKELWEHFQQRGPLDIQFKDNNIHLVFKKEVQVLKFLTF
jgi:hypothetical protein